MFTITPKLPFESDMIETTNDESNAFDIALDWSVELNGDPIMIFRNGQDWAEVTA
jgi:hypothetical protein